jgi:hypothetical protein
MRKKNLILFIACVCALAGQAYELRDWEDANGNRFKGRFVRELFGKLTIEDNDGNLETLAIEELSDVDKKYIRVMIPPKIEVEIRTKSRRMKKRPATNVQDDIEEVHSIVAQIAKKSQRPFTSRLNIEAFVVAEEVEGDNYILLGRFEDSFLLIEEKDYQYTFESKPVLTTQFTDICSESRKGELYDGHVLIITSQEGEQILLDSNLPTWMQQPELLDKLRKLSARGAPSLRSRHFDKNGEKVPPPRPRICPERTT